ncbi:phage antirepressor N-terminal domain-containing protein [Streptomyces sp. NBC_00338]|uniref:phage antirepressor N-terminal domain-containing protein n=1 Tax=Streptomyces sp. NBC_00338 TaxID=2975715 RepID=UPI0022540EDC|nr:phage antirepressor N-terminal domain-containing protein [Streptomyces sp. NBC_00338]MCX5138378.1 phage antirepressor N-terminal domain-containing protein [Streptomyces sp. NBC_00338]MCX5145167.1 phage antirepressor N-terminal domain-containing protein [Streptomyces sp. NBC_00338]
MPTSSTEPAAVVQLDLSAGSIQTTLIDGEPLVVFRPAVEAIGLDYSTQLRKLRDRSWANRRDIPTVAEDGKTRLMAAVDVRTFLMWLATVNENKVAEEVRETLVAYQRETTTAVNDYWTQGGAINPRASEEQLDSLIARAKQQAEVLTILSGIVSPQWLETKGRLVAARALGEEPEIDPLDVPLYVPDFLKGLGLKRKQIDSVQSWFGRRAVGICEELGVDAPEKRQTDLSNGSVRETKAWTERHRPVFELTWARHYAADYPAQFTIPSVPQQQDRRAS